MCNCAKAFKRTFLRLFYPAEPPPTLSCPSTNGDFPCRQPFFLSCVDDDGADDDDDVASMMIMMMVAEMVMIVMMTMMMVVIHYWRLSVPAKNLFYLD